METLIMRRPGITLLEVLSAIFITGIGLISLLTLFPLGALKMAEALKDDRTAQAGVNGQAIANAAGMRNDPLIQQAMMGQTMWSATGTQQPMPTSPDGPGWPVLVDPIGQYAYSLPPNYPAGNNWQNWVGGDFTMALIPRVTGAWLQNSPPTLTAPPNAQAILRWCSVQDDLYFVNDGPYQGLASDPPSWAQGGGLGVQRNLLCSYAWMLRMPRAGAPNVVDVSVLVFSGRSLDLVGFGTQETEYPAVFPPNANGTGVTPNPNTVFLYPPTGTTEPPAVRKGQWILDASNAIVPIPGAPPPPAPQLALVSSHGYFYRVVSVSDPILDPSNGKYYVSVEVQTPLRGWPDPNIPNPNTISSQTVVIFDNLVEVFDEGTY
jgi:hypothetical protein